MLHPLEEKTEDGVIRFYDEAEAVLAKLPRRGVPMILRHIKPPKRQPEQLPVSKPYTFSGFEKIIQRMRAEIGLPSTFTLDACRHGGMTELEEAELTDGQGRALSAHSSKAYDGYAKRTEKRALAATRKRYAHVIANTVGTSIQNADQNDVQNDESESKREAK